MLNEWTPLKTPTDVCVHVCLCLCVCVCVLPTTHDCWILKELGGFQGIWGARLVNLSPYTDINTSIYTERWNLTDISSLFKYTHVNLNLLVKITSLPSRHESQEHSGLFNNALFLFASLPPPAPKPKIGLWRKSNRIYCHLSPRCLFTY